MRGTGLLGDACGDRAIGACLVVAGCHVVLVVVDVTGAGGADAVLSVGYIR